MSERLCDCGLEHWFSKYDIGGARKRHDEAEQTRRSVLRGLVDAAVAAGRMRVLTFRYEETAVSR